MSRHIETVSFCESFLDRITAYIDENYLKQGKDLNRLGIVFGGKRPSLFLRRKLAKKIGTSFVPPQSFSMDEFIQLIVRNTKKLRQTSDLDHCYLLYQLAQEHTPEVLKGRETFASFLPWTREILKFINQLDLEDIDDKALKSVKANAEIGYAVPDDINRLLQHILILRKYYHQTLRSQESSSRGIMYLWAAQTVEELPFDEFDEILFCNFFYFHNTEEQIVKCLQAKGKASFFFQGDDRKWPILSRLGKSLSADIKEGEEPDSPGFKLKLYEGFDVHSQVCLVREILKKIKNYDRTLIVLPNPDNVIPLISEMSSLVSNYNISMGYPLKRSGLYTLFTFLFKVQNSRKKGKYYAKDYLKVLRHPFIRNLQFTNEGRATRILVNKIEEVLTGKERSEISGSIFVSLDEIEQCSDIYRLTVDMLNRLNIDLTESQIKERLQYIHEHVIRTWENIENINTFCQALDSFLSVIVGKSTINNYPLNTNIAEKMLQINDELKLLQFKHEPFPQSEIFRIFENKVSTELVAFHGQPLKGLQILGLLETRSLDFENVILMDVNESILPNLTIHEPLIPREVMISLGLDRMELEEEIQRYQFMRLISSAKNVHCVYQKSKDKERSRFIEELVWEAEKKQQAKDVVSIHRPHFNINIEPKRECIRKTPEMVEMLKKHRYSASSINMYLRNPYDFYLNYVLGLREQEDLLDEPEARQVGTFIHELLENQFKPFLNKKPHFNAEFKNNFQKKFDQQFDHAFGASMKTDSFLLKSVLNERLHRFLEHEQRSEQRRVKEVLFLEGQFEDVISLSAGDMRFRYIVDRIDLLEDGTIMIVDYKTGSVDQMPKKMEIISNMSLSRESIFDNIKSFQIPLYFHYLNKQYPNEKINAALYNLRTCDLKTFLKDDQQAMRSSIDDEFMRCLDFIVNEITDPNVDFESTV